MDWPEGRAVKQVRAFGLEDERGSIRPLHLERGDARDQEPDRFGQGLTAIHAIECGKTSR